MVKQRSTVWRFSLVALVVSGLALALTGCKDESQTNPPTNPPVQTQPQAPPLVKSVKLMPPESGENQRVYGRTADGTLVEMSIDYRDGRQEIVNFRPDGTVEKKREIYPFTGILKSVTEYGIDGTTVVLETQNRGSGTLELTRRRLADSTLETTRYRVDGKRLHSVQLIKADGSMEATFYRQDGKALRATAKSLSATETEVKFYNAAGVVERIRVTKTSASGYSSNIEFTVTGVRPDSTTAYKQAWSGYASSYYSNVSLKTVEEYEADGKTLKRILTFGYSARVTQAVDYEAGIKKEVRTYRWDGTREKTETLDAMGKVLDTKTHTSQDNLQEVVAPDLVADQSADDPLSFNPGDFG